MKRRSKKVECKGEVIRGSEEEGKREGAVRRESNTGKREWDKEHVEDERRMGNGEGVRDKRRRTALDGKREAKGR